jgi:hypothetical protein
MAAGSSASGFAIGIGTVSSPAGGTAFAATGIGTVTADVSESSDSLVTALR